MLNKINLKITALGLLLISIIAVSTGCFKGKAEVEVATVKRGVIKQSFREPARTRLARTWEISMPVDGRIGRINLEHGDRVTRGQMLVEFDRISLEQIVKESEAAVKELSARLEVKDDNSLENHAFVETHAMVRATLETIRAAKTRVEAAAVRYNRYDLEKKRIQSLAKGGSTSLTRLDDASMQADTALLELREDEFFLAALKAVAVAVRLGPLAVDDYLNRKKLERKAIQQQYIQAEARLARARHDLKLAAVTSPIDGIVLKRYTQGDSIHAAGTPLLRIGNLEELEVVADVLTRDALQLKPGSHVEMETMSSAAPIPGLVSRIEPEAFTKLSSLGIEQQRVNVIVQFESRPNYLGVGYRLHTRFFTGEKEDTLLIPRFSVFQGNDGAHYAYVVKNGKVKKTKVVLGLRSDMELEALDGLQEGDKVLVNLDTAPEDGTKVKTTKTE
jgi:HlyD family secretion protein